MPSATPRYYGGTDRRRRSTWSTPWPRRTGTATGCSIANGVVDNFGDATNFGAPVGYVNGFNPATTDLPHRRQPGLLGRLGPWRCLLLRRLALPGQHGGRRPQRRDHRRLRLLAGLRLGLGPDCLVLGTGSSATTASTTARRRGPAPAEALAGAARRCSRPGSPRRTGGSARPSGRAPSTGRARRPRGSPGGSPGGTNGPPGARSRSCGARRKCPVQGTGRRRTARPGPAPPTRRSRAGPKPVGASFTMDSV